MTSVRNAMKAKSDQLNYTDIGSGELTIKIEHVEVFDRPDQPIHIYYEGCNSRPYKPSKGMIRVMGDESTWGDESDNWVGKHLKLFGDPTITFGKEAVGGIVIRAMSNIPNCGVDIFVAKSRGKRRKMHFDCLSNAQANVSQPSLAELESVIADAGYTSQQICQSWNVQSLSQIQDVAQAIATIKGWSK